MLTISLLGPLLAALGGLLSALLAILFKVNL